jgi:Holliday junction resolvasome RuvABC ATP-dependent DNA helicase subunit
MNLRQQLHDAASRLDMEETELVINQIHHASADIAEVLYRLEQQYQFDQIIKLLNCANHF